MFLTPFYRDNAIRAHRCAECTCDTLGLVRHLCRVMTLGIDELVRHLKDLLGAGGNTKSAALTKVRIKCYFVHKIPPKVLNYSKVACSEGVTALRWELLLQPPPQCPP